MKVTEKLEITIRNETIRSETEQVTNYLGTRTNKDITDSSRSYFLRILYINGNWRKSAPSFEFTTTIGSSIYFKKRTSTAPQQRHGYVKTLQKDARWRINSASTQPEIINDSRREHSRRSHFLVKTWKALRKESATYIQLKTQGVTVLHSTNDQR